MSMNTPERLELNRQSKDRAEHDGDGWDEQELEVLMLSTGTDADFQDLAEMLGRTIEACRQKFYVTRRDGVVLGNRSRAQVYRGWTESDGDGW